MIHLEPLLSPVPASIIALTPHTFENGPASAWIRGDPWSQSRIEGSGCGSLPTVLHSAYGEYQERAFFNRERLSTDRIHRTFDLKGNPLEQRIHAALTELALRHAHTIPNENTPLHWVRVHRLGDGKATYYPEIFLSLLEKHPDRAWLPISDSTGCGGHVKPDDALTSALLEFTERQALILSWLTGYGRCLWSIELEDIKDPVSAWIYKTLIQLGSLEVYDISPWPEVHVLLALFTGAEGSAVRYSVSSAAHWNPDVALEKTLSEQWQSFRYVYDRSTRKRQSDLPLDLFQAEFLEHNNPSTPLTFPVTHREIPSIPFGSIHREKSGRKSLINALEHTSKDIFVLWGTGGESTRLTTYCKVFSPDFFLNMWITATHLNHPFLTNHPDPVLRQQVFNPIPFP